MRIVRYISWALVALVFVGVGIVYFQSANQPSLKSEVASFGGPFTLTDTNGQTFTQDNLAGKPYMIFFGFTHCPDVCPTTLNETVLWMDGLGADADKLNYVFVTVDPERDTPEILKDYVGIFSDKIIGLSGTEEQVQAISKNFKIYAKRIPLDGGGYTMDHTASVILMDAKGDFFGTIAYGEAPETALAKLKRLAAKG